MNYICPIWPLGPNLAYFDIFGPFSVIIYPSVIYYWNKWLLSFKSGYYDSYDKDDFFQFQVYFISDLINLKSWRMAYNYDLDYLIRIGMIKPCVGCCEVNIFFSIFSGPGGPQDPDLSHYVTKNIFLIFLIL